MYRKVSVGLALASLTAVIALAQQQTFVQLPNGGWVDCDNPAAAGHPDCPSAVPPESLEACVEAQGPRASNLDLLKACGSLLHAPIPGCEHVNAYEEPDRANTCAALSFALNPPQPLIRDFPLGAIFGRPYGDRKIVIVGRALGLDGVEVVTGQVVLPTSERGRVVAFVNDGGLEAGQWWPVGGAR